MLHKALAQALNDEGIARELWAAATSRPRGGQWDRNRRFVRVRDRVMYRLRESGWSFPQICRITGARGFAVPYQAHLRELKRRA